MKLVPPGTRQTVSLEKQMSVKVRHGYLDVVNIGASATLPLRSWRSGQLNAWFKCSLKVGVAILDSRTTSDRFHANVIEELRAIF